MVELSQQAQESASEDEAVIRDVLAGNVNAFAILQKKYQRVVSFLIRKMIRNEEDVADILQDTFTKAFAGLHTFQFEYAFSSWLYKIASNRCIDMLRRKRFAMYSIDAPIDGKDGEFFVEPPDHDPTPDTVLLAKERADMLKSALEELPEKYRRVIKMRHEEELDYQEIADRLQLPLGTVKAHLFRARKQLYHKLMRHGSHFEEYLAEDPDEA